MSEKQEGLDLTLREMQLVELRMLKSADAFFRKNQIPYLICGGTLIGALRHGGFIPWDDDIDLLIPRKDYDRLEQLILRDHPTFDGGHQQFHVPGEKDYPFSYIRMSDDRTKIETPRFLPKFDLSVWIDVFPLDRFPHNKILHKLYLKWFVFWRAAIMAASRRETNYFSLPKQIVAKTTARLFGLEGCCRAVDRSGRRMNALLPKSCFSGNSAYPKGMMRDYYPKDSIYPVGETKVTFEGLEFCAPYDPDRFLKAYFGDYMTLPPESEREYHYHQGRKLWRDARFRKELREDPPAPLEV